MKYTVDYFIQKFEAIPEDNWITGQYIDPEIGCCAYGWCGDALTKEANGLHMVLGKSVMTINDGGNKDYQQPNPKARILAALYDIKNAHARTPSSKENLCALKK